MKKEKISPETTEENLAPEVSVAAEPVETSVNKVGSLLKEMRLQKGLKLPDISKKLCIRKFYLEAIEESKYEDIPEFPYGIGFIRSYADYLGLNSSNIVELYKEETNTNPDKNIYVLEPQAEATVPNKKYLLVSLLAIVAIYVLWYFYNNRMSASEDLAEPEVVAATDVTDNSGLPLIVEDYSLAAEPAEPIVIDNQPAVIDVAAVEPSEQVTVTNASFTETNEVVSPQPEKVKEAAEPGSPVVIKIKKETWIEVKDANKLYISKVLQPGDSYSVPAGSGMILSVGRIDGADVLINGKVTPVVTSAKKTNIALDKFISTDNH